MTIKVASTYWIIGKSDEHLIGKGRWNKFWSLALLRIDWSRSATSTKSKGESGSPYLTPLLQCKTLPCTPLSSTEEVPVLRIFLIQFVHFSPKPLALRSWIMASCSTLSKAFSKSSFRITNSFFDLWHKWRYSKAQARQSWIVLVLMKPYWFLCMSCLIFFCSLLANTLVISLREVLRREIGL